MSLTALLHIRDQINPTMAVIVPWATETLGELEHFCGSEEVDIFRVGIYSGHDWIKFYKSPYTIQESP